LEDQRKESGSTYWVCRPCQNFGQRIKHQFAESSKRQDENEKKTAENSKRIDGTERELENLRKQMEKLAEKIESEGGEREETLYDEMQEREVRRMNLILHGVEEQPDRIKNNRERLELDKERCEQVFVVMKARTKKEDLRFCRRLGEKSAEPRPIVIGLETEEDKRHILAKARNLQGTRFHDISIVPDLTKKQRSREARMKQEAEEKNKSLTAEEKSNNVKWMVVGRRGEKRIIKGVERDVQYMGNRTTRAGDRTSNSGSRGPQLLPDAPSRGQFVPRQTDQNSSSRNEEQGRWYRKDRDETDTGARRKDNYGQANRNGGEKDKQDQSRRTRWETNSDRWTQSEARGRLNSKRGRDSTSSEDDNQVRRRTKRF
jgi:hypothetical protein